MGRRTRTVLTLTAAALLLVSALAPTQAAAKKKKQKSAPVVTRSQIGVTTTHLGVATATATCPKKTRAVGGGYSANPFNLSAQQVPIPFESVKVGQRSWRVSAQELAPSLGYTMRATAIAYCRKGAPKTAAVSATVTDPGTAQHFGPPATATCAGKRKAMSGGFVTNTPLAGTGITITTTESFRSSSKAWTADSFHNTVGANSLTAFAYCAEGKLPAAVSSTGAPVTTAAGAVTQSASCPAKRRVVGGGFQQVGETGTSLDFVLGSQAVGSTWQASGFKNSSAPVSLTSIAYCG